LLLSCFHDFWLFKWNSWIGVWLLLKHVWIHFINDCLCLCFDDVWIGVVVLKFEWEMRKMVVFGGNELDDDLRWIGILIRCLLWFLMPLYVCNQVFNFWGRIWGWRDQNWGFWMENGVKPVRVQLEQGKLAQSECCLEKTRLERESRLKRVAQWQHSLFWVFQASGVDPGGSKLILLM